jgi:hypothetical protein
MVKGNVSNLLIPGVGPAPPNVNQSIYIDLANSYKNICNCMYIFHVEKEGKES